MTSPGDDGSNGWPRLGREDEDPVGDGLCEEPMVDVPAGLLGQAIELLDLCDEVVNRPGHNVIDARVSAVISRYQRADAAILRWFHDGLCVTAAELRERLDDWGIIVEPMLRGRRFPATACR